jgi:hypothetical protein
MKKALPSQNVFQDASDRRAKDGEFEMSLAVSGRLASCDREAPPVGDGSLACTSDNKVAHSNIAAILVEHDRLKEALKRYRRVLESISAKLPLYQAGTAYRQPPALPAPQAGQP